MSQRQIDSTRNKLDRIGDLLDNFQRKRTVIFDIEHRSVELLKYIKQHTQMMLREIIKGMRESYLHQQIYDYAQVWRMTHGYAIEKSMREFEKAKDEGASKVIFSLMTENIQGRPDNWFDLPDYDKKYTTFARNAYGKSSGRSFSRNGIFINVNMEKPEIASAIATRSNFIAELPDDQFTIMQDVLYKKYYLEGMHPDQLAKEFTASNLWDEFYIGRSKAIARTETMSIVSMARRSDYLTHGMTGHFWLIAFDNLVRTLHLDNNNDGVIPINDAFFSGQKFPGDGSDASLIVNCRCSEEATMLPEGDVSETSKVIDRNAVLENYHLRGYEDVLIPQISTELSRYFKFRGLTAALVDEVAEKVYYNYYPEFTQ